ncbi:MAG: hypothetical protein RBR50_01030 [Candidatus Izemoplasmatales bacterium]|nr:hypothetical protein [Candidatus Izemoplasmatales bacterium]
MQEIITTVTFRDMDELQEYINMIGYIKFHENVFITCNLGANIRMVKKPDDKNMRDIKESVKYKQYRADIVYTKLISRALKMFGKESMTDFNRKVNGYSNPGKPYFLAAFRLSKYNVNDKYQTQWDNAR